MREIVHIQAGQCGNQIGAKVSLFIFLFQWNEILFFFKFGSFWCPPFSISRRRGFYCHTWFFFLVLITSLMLIYIVMSERSYDSKTEPKICKIVIVYLPYSLHDTFMHTFPLETLHACRFHSSFKLKYSLKPSILCLIQNLVFVLKQELSEYRH